MIDKYLIKNDNLIIHKYLAIFAMQFDSVLRLKLPKPQDKKYVVYFCLVDF